MKSIPFILLLIGRLATNIGDSMYTVASMWLVFELTHDPFFTGLAGFLTTVPIVMQFLIGPIVDRLNHKPILVLSQLVQFVLILIIPVANYFNILSVWLILTIMPLAVLIQQFVYPTQSALLPHIVKSEDLVKANSLMTLTYQGSDIIITSISGITLSVVGAINLLFYDSFVFLFSAVIFNLARLPKKQKRESESTPWKEIVKVYKNDLSDGYRFIHKSFIPKFLIPAVVANFMIGAVTANLPNYAFLRGGEEYYGYYLSALAAGMLIGTLLAPFMTRFPLGKLTIIGFITSGVSWTLSAVVSLSILSVVLFGISQIALGMTNILFISTLQNLLPKKIMGRVFTFIASFTTVASPLGALSGGITASFLGSEKIFFLGGIAAFFVAGYWLFHPFLRSIPSPSKMLPEEYGLGYEEKVVSLET